VPPKRPNFFIPRDRVDQKGDPVATARATSETLCQARYGNTRRACGTQYKACIELRNVECPRPLGAP